MPRVRQPSLPDRPLEIGYVERKSASNALDLRAAAAAGSLGRGPGLQVLAAILGEGFGSRLGMALREENGLTYGANAEVVRGGRRAR